MAQPLQLQFRSEENRVLLRLAGQPLEIIAATTATAATGGLAEIQGKIVEIVGEAHQVAAFIWAAREWLWEQVRGVIIVNDIPVAVRLDGGAAAQIKVKVTPPEKQVFRCLVLRGGKLSLGIPVEDGRIPFTPRWGYSPIPQDLGTVETSQPLARVYHARVHREDLGWVPIIYPYLEQDQPRNHLLPELVLLQTYTSPGPRGKSFDVCYGDAVEVVSRARTRKGRGGEEWILLTAPPGWAENIASQFHQQQDKSFIRYCPPPMNWAGIRLEVVEGEQALVHLASDPREVIRGIEAMGWWAEWLSSRFAHLFGPPEAVGAFVYRVPLRSFTVNGALVVPPDLT